MFWDPIVNWFRNYGLSIVTHPVTVPLIIIGGSVGIIKYLVLPFFIPEKYHARVLLGIVGIDLVLLGVSYVTGLLSLPFGLAVPTIDLSGYSIGQSQIALILSLAGTVAYVTVLVNHEHLNFPSIRVKMPVVGDLNYVMLGVTGLIAGGAVFVILGLTGNLPQLSLASTSASAIAIQLATVPMSLPIWFQALIAMVALVAGGFLTIAEDEE